MDTEAIDIPFNSFRLSKVQMADRQDCPRTLPPLRQVMAELETAEPIAGPATPTETGRRRSFSDAFMVNDDFPPRVAHRRTSVTAHYPRDTRWPIMCTPPDHHDAVYGHEACCNGTCHFAMQPLSPSLHHDFVLGPTRPCRPGCVSGLPDRNAPPGMYQQHQYYQQQQPLTRPLRLLPGLAPALSKRHNVRFVGYGEVDGESVYLYSGGFYLPTHVDGEPVNALWGLTKANTPRKRLATACDRCRLKKTRCEPQPDGCPQCQRVGEVCHMSFGDLSVLSCVQGE